VKATAHAIGACIGVIVGTWNLSLNAEEMLEKESNRFLGWQINTAEFTTCDKNVIKIAPGKVVKTIQKCQGPVFAVQDEVFNVESVNASNRTLRVVNASNRAGIDLFYPETAETPDTMKFDWIKPGQKLGVRYFDAKFPVLGGFNRAESIKPIDKPKDLLHPEVTPK
jgi:hypothetical protein